MQQKERTAEQTPDSHAEDGAKAAGCGPPTFTEQGFENEHSKSKRLPPRGIYGGAIYAHREQEDLFLELLGKE